MPSHLKKLIRARRLKTGESYEAALRHVRSLETRPTSRPMHVWWHGDMLCIAESAAEAEQAMVRLARRMGHTLPWLLAGQGAWSQMDDDRELRLGTTRRIAAEWAAQLAPGLMAVVAHSGWPWLRDAHWLNEWAKGVDPPPHASGVDLTTYYAVVQGDPGSQCLRPVRTTTRETAFAYVAPRVQDDAEMRAVFDRRFLPLKVSSLGLGGLHELADGHSFEGDDAYEDARRLAVTLTKHPDSPRWAVIATADDHIVSLLPERGLPAPLPFALAEQLARQGMILGRGSWRMGRFLASPPNALGTYAMHREDDRVVAWKPSAEDRAASDWTSLTPYEAGPWASAEGPLSLAEITATFRLAAARRPAGAS